MGQMTEKEWISVFREGLGDGFDIVEERIYFHDDCVEYFFNWGTLNCKIEGSITYRFQHENFTNGPVCFNQRKAFTRLNACEISKGF